MPPRFDGRNMLPRRFRSSAPWGACGAGRLATDGRGHSSGRAAPRISRRSRTTASPTAPPLPSATPQQQRPHRQRLGKPEVESETGKTTQTSQKALVQARRERNVPQRTQRLFLSEIPPGYSLAACEGVRVSSKHLHSYPSSLSWAGWPAKRLLGGEPAAHRRGAGRPRLPVRPHHTAPSAAQSTDRWCSVCVSRAVRLCWYRAPPGGSARPGSRWRLRPLAGRPARSAGPPSRRASPAPSHRRRRAADRPGRTSPRPRR